MKNHTHKPSTSQKLVHNNSLWQEIPEDSAQTIQGGTIFILILSAQSLSTVNTPSPSSGSTSAYIGGLRMTFSF